MAEKTGPSQTRARQVVMDTATLYGLLHAFTMPRAQEWPIWTLQCAYNATALTLSTQWLQLPPAPNAPDYSLLSERLISRLNGFLGKGRPRTDDIAAHTTAINDHVTSHLVEVREGLDRARRQSSFVVWREHAVNRFWVELSRLQRGLFDEDFIPALAALLNISDNELRTAWARSRDLQQVEAWSRGRSIGEDYEICLEAYFVGNCIRGAYYDSISRAFYKEDQILLHPMRQVYLGRGAIQPIKLEENNTLDHLVAVLLGAAMSQRSAEARVANWCTNVRKVREDILAGYTKAEPCDMVSVRERKVWEIVKRLDLEVHTKATERIASGISSVSSFGGSLLLGLWSGEVLAGTLLGALGVTLAFTKAREVPAGVVKRLGQAHSKIDKLHHLGGGRLIQRRGIDWLDESSSTPGGS